MKSDKKAEWIWDRIDEIHEKNRKVTEEEWLKIQRKMFSVPEAIQLLFITYKAMTKSKVQEYEKMRSEIKKEYRDDPSTQLTMSVFAGVLQKVLEKDLIFFELLESISLHQVELQKDLAKVIRSLEKTEKNKSIVTQLQNKMKTAENDLQEFRKSKNYIQFTKRFFDERGSHKEDD